MDDLRTRGYARLGALLTRDECEATRALYADPDLFRSRIDLARYRFGRGEYQYFSYPLPARIDALRHELYSQLAPAAMEWMAALKLSAEYPPSLDDFLTQCHDAGQPRPTPLLLRYRAGDFNCLHQDLYGEIFFHFRSSRA